MPMTDAPAMLKSARLAPTFATAKTAYAIAKETRRRPQGAHLGSLPEVSDADGAGAVRTLMSVRSRELGAAGDDPARQRIDREGHDEEDEPGRDQRVHAGA